MNILSALALAPAQGLDTDDLVKATGIELRCIYTFMQRLRNKGLAKTTLIAKKGKEGLGYRYARHWLLADGKAIARGWHSFINTLSRRQRQQIGWDDTGRPMSQDFSTAVRNPYAKRLKRKTSNQS